MKKLLLTLGALTSVAAPVAAVVACGSTPAENQTIKSTKENYTKQVADSSATAAEKKVIQDKIDALKDVEDIQKLTEELSAFTTAHPHVAVQAPVGTITGPGTGTGTVTAGAGTITGPGTSGTITAPTAGVGGAAQGNSAYEDKSKADTDAEQAVVNALVSTVKVSNVIPDSTNDPLTSENAKTKFGIQNFVPKKDFFYTYVNDATTVTITVTAKSSPSLTGKGTPINIKIS